MGVPKFLIGQTVKCVKGRFADLIGKIQHESNVDGHWIVVGKDDGQLYDFESEYIVPIHQFNVGDRVTFGPGTGPGYGHTFMVVRISETNYHITSDTFMNNREFEVSFESAILHLFAIDGCQHNWQIFHGFRFDDEFCTKCQAKRAIAS